MLRYVIRIEDKTLFFLYPDSDEMCTHIHIVYTIYKTLLQCTDRAERSYSFPQYPHFCIFKRFSVIICLKLNIRDVSSGKMLKHIIFYKKGLMIIFKLCFKRLILSPQIESSRFFFQKCILPQTPPFILGADLKNNQTTKQLNNFILTNRKVETKLSLHPIGPSIVDCRVKSLVYGPNIIVHLFSCLIVFKIPSLHIKH